MSNKINKNKNKAPLSCMSNYKLYKIQHKKLEVAKFAMVYNHHFSHSAVHISSVTPSSAACPVGVQFLPCMRGGSVE